MSVRSAELYDLRTKRIDSDRQALVDLVGAGSTLEVGCGTGRVLQWLAQSGCRRLVGVERDSDMLEIARRKFEGLEGVELVRSDFLDFRTGEKFDRVLFAFNVLAEFQGPERRIAALSHARNLLAPDGCVVVVNMMHNFEDFSRSATHREFEIGSGKETWTVTIHCSLDRVVQRSFCRVAYHNVATGEEVRDAYVVDLLTRSELRACYIAAGLSIAAEYGSYALGRVDEESDVLISVLKSQS